MNSNDQVIRDPYAAEAEQLWGNTEAYKESERRMADAEQETLRDGMDTIMEGFAKLNARGVSPDHEASRLQVKKLRTFISEHMYRCTDEILAGLGELYIRDERFTRNIDRHGEGTAAYTAACIKRFIAGR